MIFRETIEGKTYWQIPDKVLDKQVETLRSLKAVYMYAKLLMLHDKNYSREIWVTNPISKEKEMSIDTMSDVTGKLEMAGLIQVNKYERENDWPINSYEIVAQPGDWKPVYSDFINRPDLSADAKGLAILLSLLKFIPRSATGIGKAIGMSGKTVKKYLVELIRVDVYDPVRCLLNEDWFPYWRLVRESDARYKVAMTHYKECARMMADKEMKKAFSGYGQRFWEWLRRLPESEEVKARIWLHAHIEGEYKKSPAEKRQTEDERKAKEDKIKKINL